MQDTHRAVRRRRRITVDLHEIATAELGATLAANRTPLAFMFLTLEALLLAAAAAWVWSRNTPVDMVPDEVLSP